jgi:hypothetical protein
MSRTIVVVMVMGGAHSIRIAHNNCQPSIDWREHKTRGNEGAKAQQSEYERRNPTGCAAT